MNAPRRPSSCLSASAPPRNKPQEPALPAVLYSKSSAEADGGQTAGANVLSTLLKCMSLRCSHNPGRKAATKRASPTQRFDIKTALYLRSSIVTTFHCNSPDDDGERIPNKEL